MQTAKRPANAKPEPPELRGSELKIGLIAPPFIPVPPVEYGGTELFVAHLAEFLQKIGAEVVVYTNGESTVDVEKRWLFKETQWPLKNDDLPELKDVEHTCWALLDANEQCDIVHLNTPNALACSRSAKVSLVYTLHHPTNKHLTKLYSRFPQVDYVCISDDQRGREIMPKTATIHHGIDLSQYRFQEKKQPYLSFIGRIAPIKGTHLAVEIAQKCGIPLKIAGEVQPEFREYFEAKVKPHIDGRFIEFVGLADLKLKNELLGNSMAMLFPIQWDEPFGLVMVEAMACGTPVLALKHGSVPEIVRNGVSGYCARRVNDLVKHARDLRLSSTAVREYAEAHFSAERMAENYLTLYRSIVDRQLKDVA